MDFIALMHDWGSPFAAPEDPDGPVYQHFGRASRRLTNLASYDHSTYRSEHHAPDAVVNRSSVPASFLPALREDDRSEIIAELMDSDLSDSDSDDDEPGVTWAAVPASIVLSTIPEEPCDEDISDQDLRAAFGLLNVSGQGSECTICLEDNSDVVTRCGHHFHTRCISKWLTDKGSCPNCRAPLQE